MAAARETGMTFGQLAAMDGADYGALLEDIRDAPPVSRWMPQAFAELLARLGSEEPQIEMLRRWGFRLDDDGPDDHYDRMFLEAMRK